MKNAKSILVGAMMVMSISTYADAIKSSNNALHISVEDKRTVSVLNKVLPDSVTAVETPAPQKAVSANEKQLSPEQKAATVELELKNAPKK
ncbi:hypothetical protein [Dyadobacter sp. 32]|jgi:hypothetical protein|uniref:hypothetical protein n=1 Tax=Dyadobacter sp. 32 TaxID=538966 RepID=UPI0011EDE79B